MKAYQNDNLATYIHNMKTWLTLDTTAYDYLPNGSNIWSDAYKWYPQFGAFALNLGSGTSLPKENVIGAFSILSANVKVSVNISEFKALLVELETGKETMRLQSPDNKNKARLAIRGDLGQVKGGKIIAFNDNLLKGNKSEMFTLDTHMIRSLQNHGNVDLIPGLQSGSIKGADFKVMQIAALEVAHKNYIPIPVLQAYIWLLARSIKNEEYDSGLQHLV
jgi:hypothetical protein